MTTQRPEAPLERVELLMMKAVDAQLEPHEAEELERLLADAPQRRAELADHLGVKALTDALTQRILADATIESPRPTRPARALVGVATALLVTAALLLGGYGLFHLMTDPGVALVVKLGTGLGVAGLALLLVYALVVRARGARRDPYLEIDQ